MLFLKFKDYRENKIALKSCSKKMFSFMIKPNNNKYEYFKRDKMKESRKLNIIEEKRSIIFNDF